jgi:ABC-type sugar transport system ATPase subunit
MSATNQGLVVANLVKHFGATEALRGVSLDIAPGEVVALTGPSGAGKTTLCRSIAGLEIPTAGEISNAGCNWTALPAAARRVAFLFESYALYPHLTVFENVASPLRVPDRFSAMDAPALNAKVMAQLAMVAIADYAARLPAALSGGQKQRVGLARALVQDDAAVTLLDEPISHLDAKLRHRLRGEIKDALAARSAPALWVTPDNLEAMAVGDRMAVMINGQIVQCDTPEQIWRNPASLAVARLIGDPPINLLSGQFTSQVAGGQVTLSNGMALALPPAAVPQISRLLAGQTSNDIVIGVKPRDVTLTPSMPMGEIFACEPFGKHSLVSVQIGKDLVRVKTRTAIDFKPGDRVGITIDGPVNLFNPANGCALSAEIT